jgi:hypothetical protein
VERHNDELIDVGKPFDPLDFNLYLLKGPSTKFKDLVTTLMIWKESVS